MKTKRLILSGTILMVAASITITSCRKPKEKDEDTAGAQDNALAEGTYNDMHQIANEASKGSVTSYKNLPEDGILAGSCATVSFDTLNHAHADSITVDFGTVNCPCNDGRNRRGKIYISYTAGKHYWDSSATINITTKPTDSYYVNDNQVIGTKIVTNKGHNSAGHMNWDVNVNGSIVKSSGGTITWQSTRNREWTVGETTPFVWYDDVYSITGSATGTSVAGNTFNVQIDASAPLVKKMNCFWIVTGNFSFDPGNGKPIRYVDFSPKTNGSCDNWFSVTINGNTYYKQM